MLRLCVVLLTGFMLAAILTRLQPTGAAPLEAFLSPAGMCPGICYLGIQPGVSTVEEAAALLQGHAWVDAASVDVHLITAANGRNRGTVSWRWNGQQPPIARNPSGLDGVLEIEDNVVRIVRLITAVPVGEVWLLLNDPEPGHRPSALWLFRIYNPAGKPWRVSDFWRAPVEMVIEDDSMTMQGNILPCGFACS